MRNEILQQRIATIKARAELISEMDRRGVALVPSGTRLEGHCPFHEDSTPSLSVYRETQQFHCFGCGAHGDIIDFVQQIEGLTFIEALRELEKGLGTPAIAHHLSTTRERRLHSPKPDETSIEKHIPILSMALSIYRQTLSRHTPSLSYLAERGISKRTREQLALGYSDGHTLRQIISDHGGAFHAAQQAGLLTRNGKEWFSGRIVIPEVRRGEQSCLWMIGRLLPNLAPQMFVVRREQRYLGLMLPKPLLGYAHAIEQIRSSDSLHGILLVEGAIDYVLAREWQLPAIPVALLSTHPSHLQWEQLHHLLKIRPLPLLDWHDADMPGRLGALSTWDRLDGYPGLMIPEIEGIKDLADLALHPLGYAQLAHAWQGMSDGDAL